LLYLITAKVGLALSVAHGSATPVWAPTGIALASLLLFGKRMWPAVAVGAFAANITTPIPAAAAFGIAFGNTAEALVGAYLMERGGFRVSFERVRDVVLLVGFAAILATAIAATIGVSTLVATNAIHPSSFGEHWGIWWVGDMMGALIVAPLLLVWIGDWKNRPQGRAEEGVLLAVLFVVTALLVLSEGRWVYACLLFPLMLWAAFRFRQHGTTLATFLVAFLAIWRILASATPSGRDVTSAVEIYQVLIGVIGVSLLVLAATISERRRAELSLSNTRRAEEHIRRALEREHEANERLQALDEMKTTFLHAVSHDLRTPLTSILGLAVTLERPDIDLPPGESRQLAARIAVNARRLDRLVNDLLDLERLDRGLLEPNRSPTDVGAIVRTAVREVDLGDRSLHVSADPAVAAVDRVEVERIVINLLSNEARHTPPGTNVWVSVESDNGSVIIKVEDSGPGIPPDARARIFEPFGRAGGSDPNVPGLGIGLSLVARFAELHGGKAWVEDRAGGGSSFTVLLPSTPAGTRVD
jgi:signal transduction histidine kinase